MNQTMNRIAAFNAGRIPDMVRYKYHYMGKNLFRFYRATAHLFYEDLAKIQLPASPLGWLCGDLHLENVGSYKGNNGLVYFLTSTILTKPYWHPLPGKHCG